MTQLTPKTYDEFTREKAAVVKVYTPWCGPCRLLSPVFKDAEQYHKKVAFYELNAEEQRSIAEKYDVKTVPTVLFFCGGVVVYRSTGVVGKNVLNENIAKLNDKV